MPILGHMAEPVVSVEQLSFRYPGASTLALHDVSLTVEQGECLTLMGATGAGKTTLCLALVGIVPQFFGGELYGAVRVGGLDTLEHPVSVLARKVGLVFQDPETQLTATSVEHEVAFALENLCVRADEIRARVDEALYAVGLGSGKEAPARVVRRAKAAARDRRGPGPQAPGAGTRRADLPARSGGRGRGVCP